MAITKIIYVFRKSNNGNFSIEKVYNSIHRNLEKRKDNTFSFDKIVLKYNYDFSLFFRCFFQSLFSKKHIVHVTGACHYMILAFPFKEKILTIHDLYHYGKFTGFKGYVYDLIYYKLPVKFCNKIILVSESIQKQLLGHFPESSDKITVIPNPLIIPSDKINFRTREFDRSTPIRIIQIGSLKFKNYGRLIEATKHMNVTYDFIHGNDIYIQKLIREHAIEDRAEVHCNITEEELYRLYFTSDVLFFASEAEGFGLPIIEAQACGLPVITSIISPMNVVGNGAILVDPFNVADITFGFLKLYDPDITTKVVEDGIGNSKNYNINDIAFQYLSFYSKL